MPHPSAPPRVPEPARGQRPGRDRVRRGRGIVPLALATAATLVLGGAAVARSATTAPLDAYTDLEFSLDGVHWTDAPDRVLGAWGCELAGGQAARAQDGPIGGTPRADPCAMSPGDSIDRTYHVRNATTSGRTGRYEVGIGDYVVSDSAEFDVTSTITGPLAADSQTVTLYGGNAPGAGEPPAAGSVVAALDLAPGQSATIVDAVSVPREGADHMQRQSVTPMIWVSFSEDGIVDSDGDGLPDDVEAELGTDPSDSTNRLSDGTVGRGYGPARLLPAMPQGATLAVDESTVPPGMRLVDGALTGTPTQAGTFDVAFTVTLADGATYSSVSRVVIHPGSSGSPAEPPRFVWPIVVAGVIGVIGVVIGPAAGSLAGSLGGSLSNSVGGSLGDEPGPIGSAGSGRPAGGPGSAGEARPAAPGGPASAHDPARDSDPVSASSPGAGRVAADSVTSREGAPSPDWVRANSQVRGSLAGTGVAVADLVLWALTAAAAGVTLTLLASRRRRRDETDAPAATDPPATEGAPPTA